MARLACKKTTLLFATLALLLPALLAAESVPGSDADPAGRAMAEARSTWERGNAQAALDSLRKLRGDFPESPIVLDSLALSVDICLATGDQYLARAFLQKLLSMAPKSAPAFKSSLRVAEHYYGARSYLAALEYYRDAVESFGADSPPADRPAYDLALLRVAELSLYHEKNPRAARQYFRLILARNLPSMETPLYRALRVRLVWETLRPELLGLNDANVSSLRVDGDDLWIGTWNGGVARYSVSSGRSDAFPSPVFSRSIEIADRRVWIGTAEGLAWYGKGTGRWGTEEDFQSPSPRKVQAVKLASDALYAGTLGDGLFRLGADGWEEVIDGDLPGRFITSIAEDARGGDLLIGTLNLGLVVLDRRTGGMKSLAEIDPAFTALNVTTILPDDEERVWIGTYGEGLFLWTRKGGDPLVRPNDGAIQRFSKDTGEIGDDWILAGCETSRAIYFGSFGGGVSAFVKADGSWKRYGIAQGLPSLDIDAIAWREPYVFFGTLGAGVSVYDEAADGAEP